jgi:ABC-type nickel/cobalt efflux system permease component RcnA
MIVVMGGSSNGDNQTPDNNGGWFVGVFSLRDVVFLCVGVAVVVACVVVAVLLFTYKKALEYLKKNRVVDSQINSVVTIIFGGVNYVWFK